jgi:aminoglycoside phosphotransferase (APT) family kinase protein
MYVPIMKTEISEIELIPNLKRANEISPILEGYSEESKFRVRIDGRNILVRTFDVKEWAKKKLEFSVLGKLEAMGVRCSSPIEIGQLGRFGFMILSYFEGLNGEETMPKLAEEEQFRAGIDAGLVLKKMNSLTAPEGTLPWAERRLEKSRRYLAGYLAGPNKFKDDARVIAFLEANLSIIENRPNTFQHDDFHLKNLIFRDGKLEGVIDFNRYDWGDPVHEFLKAGQFCANVSTAFCIGQIQGYFDGRNPPEDFWQLYSLYLAMSAFSSVIWTKHVCPDEMPLAIEIIERFVDDHRGFETIVPRWYSQ